MKFPLVWPNPLSYIFEFEGTQISNSSKYFTGLSSMAEKIVIVQPVLAGEL